jgi:hypothetical protein
MKKTVFTFFAALLAFCACQEAEPTVQEVKTYDITKLRFNLSIERDIPTKGVRSGWLDGDVVFVFFENVTSAYLTVTYNQAGNSWSDVPVCTGNLPANLPENGLLTAVYLPYGNNLTPSWNGSAWTFRADPQDPPLDYYYMQCQKATYFITDKENNLLPTLGSYLYMETASGYIQFFIPDPDASGSIKIASNNLIPAGIAGISLDGTISDTSPDLGSWVTARAGTIGGDTGYYASGKLSPRPTLQCYFAMDNSGTYSHYYKQRTSNLTAQGAYRLPALSSWTAASSSYMEIAGYKWLTVNEGADTPWEFGTPEATIPSSGNLPEGTMIATDVDWGIILDRSNVAWVQVSLLGMDGFLAIDRATPTNFIFLPRANYWSSTATDNTQHFLEMAADGSRVLVEDSTPSASPYVRLVSSLYDIGLNQPENGGDI